MTRATRSRRQSLLLFPLLGCLLAIPNTVLSQQSARSDAGKSIDANRLAKEVIENELAAQSQDQSLWKYRESQQKDGKQETFDVVQTRSGEVQRLIAVNGEPLSSKEQAAEDRRIQKLLVDRSEWQKKQKSRDEDARREREMLEMIPVAFRYEYDGAERGLWRLRFKPNPDFHPKTNEGEVFHHMEGILWVEPKQKRMAELDGRLLDEVKFGGGFLGHLNAGGTFSVKQTDVGGGHWQMTLLDVKMNGKALFFKTIAVREKETDSNFTPVPGSLSLQQAAEILQTTTAS